MIPNKRWKVALLQIRRRLGKRDFFEVVIAFPNKPFIHIDGRALCCPDPDKQMKMKVKELRRHVRSSNHLRQWCTQNPSGKVVKMFPEIRPIIAAMTLSGEETTWEAEIGEPHG